MNALTINRLFRTLLVIAALGLSACSGSRSSSSDANTATGDFSINQIQQLDLVEGDAAGVNIPVNISRAGGHNKNIMLSIDGVQDSDNRMLSYSFAPRQLSNGQTSSMINVRLAIDDLPIQEQQRTLTIGANDGGDTATTEVLLNIKPVAAPDVYLLIGQSNMVGFSGDGTKLADIGGPDEPNGRIKQLNVTQNDQYSVFTNRQDFTSTASNVVQDNILVVAEDPLHEPLVANSNEKGFTYIGLGLTFAKTALNNTTQDIVLVPSAWSGSSFCENDGGPMGHWNAQPTDDANLGNTWLFDRAVTRTNIALQESGGILRGILWHQGESDSNDACAASYAANLERLAQQLRLNIEQDRRGGELRRANANIPFVLGTMSRGIDQRADLSFFWDAKQRIDDAHRTLPSKISHAAVAINDDITPANGYPCGNDTCIHFGAEGLREMGKRYYDGLMRAVANP